MPQSPRARPEVCHTERVQHLHRRVDLHVQVVHEAFLGGERVHGVWSARGTKADEHGGGPRRQGDDAVIIC